jgi:hypothetical protein
MKIKYNHFAVIIFLVGCVSLQAQDDVMDEKFEQKVIKTFKDTRVINAHSVETLQAHKLDFRITHRFGDLAGAAGGWPTFYGLENAADVAMALEYGLNDNITIGVSRTKGSGPLKQNVLGLLKIAIMKQEINGNLPFSLTVLGRTSYSTMQKSQTEGVLHFFDKEAHRLSYHLGIYAARKFGERFSLQANAAWTYRNIVSDDDQNDLVSVGGAMRLQVTKVFGLIFDATVPFSALRTTVNGFYPAFGVGFEFDTHGGHVFQINLTNSTGIEETDYIPYTRSNWGEGEFRLGFTVSRLFSL